MTAMTDYCAFDSKVGLLKDLKRPALFLACIVDLRQSHFNSRIFRIYAKFCGIWRVTKLNVYKGRIALFDFQ